MGSHGIDLTNQKYGMLVAQSPTEKRDPDKSIIWKCLCKCGAEVYRSTHYLRSKRNPNPSCEFCKKKPTVLIGRKFGRLEVLKLVRRGRNAARLGHNREKVWLCKCECGTEVEKTTNKLRKFKVPKCFKCTRNLNEVTSWRAVTSLETEVLNLRLAGVTNRAIADKLSITLSKVDWVIDCMRARKREEDTKASEETVDAENYKRS